MLKLDFGNIDDGFIGFIETCLKTVKQNAPCKQKYVQGNHFPFLIKQCQKKLWHAEGIAL